jgi:hypothetical protein
VGTQTYILRSHICIFAVTKALDLRISSCSKFNFWQVSHARDNQRIARYYSCPRWCLLEFLLAFLSFCSTSQHTSGKLTSQLAATSATLASQLCCDDASRHQLKKTRFWFSCSHKRCLFLADSRKVGSPNWSARGTQPVSRAALYASYTTLTVQNALRSFLLCIFCGTIAVRSITLVIRHAADSSSAALLLHNTTYRSNNNQASTHTNT